MTSSLAFSSRAEEREISNKSIRDLRRHYEETVNRKGQISKVTFVDQYGTSYKVQLIDFWDSPDGIFIRFAKGSIPVDELDHE